MTASPYPPPAGPERGDETRERLVAAALEEFGRHGYDGVTTRALARRAGVNLAAIPYYFGGKQGLYLAVAAHIADELGAAVGAPAAAVRRALQGDSLDRDTLLRHLDELLGTLLRLLAGGDRARFWAGYVVREQMNPTAAFDVVYERLIRPLHETVSTLVARLLGLPDAAPEAVLRAHAIVGQVLVFRNAREAILRRMGWSDFTEERLALVTGLVLHQVHAGLAGEAPRKEPT